MKLPEDLHTSDTQRAELSRLLSGGRMNSYTQAVQAAAGAPYSELDLYVYNMALAGALLGPLHILEIATRNAIHELLVTRAGRRDWWVDVTIDGYMSAWARNQITKAGDKVVAARGPGGAVVSADDVVAATEFGFWSDLLKPAYERTLWQETVRHAFPNSRRSRHQMYQAIQSHRRLRNRVTHHEPLHIVDAQAAYDDILRFIGFISKPVATWVDDRSRLAVVVKARPGGAAIAVPYF